MKLTESGKSFRGTVTSFIVMVFMATASTSALAADKLIVQDSTGAINKFVVSDTGSITTPNFVVNDTGKIGIGTSAPGSGITVDTKDQFVSQYVNHYTGDGVKESPGMLFLRNRTTGLPLKDDRLGYILMGGFGSDSKNRNGGGIVGYAESDWSAGLPGTYPVYFAIETTQASTRTEKLRVTGDGKVGIGTTVPTSSLQVVGIPVFANNGAAVTGGLTAGAFYRTGSDPDMLCVVH